MLRRLSPGPTIPELMDAELAAWCAARTRAVGACPPVARRFRSRACFVAASATLVGARVLLRLRLIEPDYAAGAFRHAARLTRTGLSYWREGL